LVSYGGAELNISITANIILDEVSFADYDGAPIGNSVYGAPPSGSSTGYHGGPVPPPKPPVSSRNILLYSAIAIIGLIILSISVRGFMNFLYARQAENSQVAQSQGSVNIPPGLDNQSIQTRLLSASYSSDCVKQYPDAGFSRVITVKNGIWDNGREESDKRASFQIVGKKVILANLTGNGRQEAVVETYCGMENQTLGYEEIYVIDPSSKSMKVLQKFSPRDWGESSLGITWSMTGVEAEDGELRVGYRLGGSHAQPDWNATTGFRWNGRHFVRVNFEARGESGEAHEHQSIQKVMPIDEAYRDSTLVTFRDDLLAAVKRRDANYLYQTVSPTMVVGFGAEANTREEFIKAWNMTAPDSKLWSVLLQVLQNGGTFVDFNGRQQYVARSTFGAWPKSVDSFEHCAVIAPQASMYSLPDTGSTVIKTLSYDVVKPDSSALCTQDQEWIKVSTGTGDSGFIQTKALRSPIDYRAAFEKIDGRWIMTSLVAGD
jgi:hypothetical protein